MRNQESDWRPRRLEEGPVPQRARHVVQQLGVELLAPEPCALVFLDDLLEERTGEVGAVIVCAAAGDDDGGVGDEILFSLVGRGVVVTMTRGSAPSRSPNISMSQASG